MFVSRNARQSPREENQSTGWRWNDHRIALFSESGQSKVLLINGRLRQLSRSVCHYFGNNADIAPRSLAHPVLIVDERAARCESFSVGGA